MEHELPEILKVKEVAALLRCNVAHVRRLIEAGKFKGVFDVGSGGKHREFRIPLQFVLAFMNVDEQSSKPEPVEPKPVVEGSAPRLPKIFKPTKNRISLLGDLERMKRQAME
jgi:excisionase family DNA binding protein